MRVQNSGVPKISWKLKKSEEIWNVLGPFKAYHMNHPILSGKLCANSQGDVFKNTKSGFPRGGR